MAAIIPLLPVPAQAFTTTLAGQQCRITLHQRSTGFYMGLTLSDQPLIMGAACLNGLDMIRNPASPLPGPLYFTDTQGRADPDHAGLGSRFLLCYGKAIP